MTKALPILTASLALGLALAPATADAAMPLGDALHAKPVLAHLLGSPADFDAARLALNLDADRAQALRDLAEEERAEVFALHQRAREMGVADPTPEAVSAYNLAVSARVERSAAGLTAILGVDGLDALLNWAEPRWEAASRRGGIKASSATAVTYEVFCTQYNGFTPYEAAIPDKYVKFSVLGWEYHAGYPDGLDYSLDLNRDGTRVTGPVSEVGPWNIDDNYWNAPNDPERPRRLFTDLPKGTPEAQVAFYDDYNNGKDQSGRTVLNPAGCDLTPNLAADLGLAYLQNDWIQVTYNWESGGGSTPTGCPVAAAPATEPLRGGGIPGLMAVFGLMGLGVIRRRRG